MKPDPRLSEVERLEAQAAELRLSIWQEFVANFPTVGERVLVRRQNGLLKRVATVANAWPDQKVLLVEYDDYLGCRECGQATRKDSERVHFDQIVERHCSLPLPNPPIVKRPPSQHYSRGSESGCYG